MRDVARWTQQRERVEWALICSTWLIYMLCHKKINTLRITNLASNWTYHNGRKLNVVYSSWLVSRIYYLLTFLSPREYIRLCALYMRWVKISRNASRWKPAFNLLAFRLESTVAALHRLRLAPEAPWMALVAWAVDSVDVWTVEGGCVVVHFVEHRWASSH